MATERKKRRGEPLENPRPSKALRDAAHSHAACSRLLRAQAQQTRAHAQQLLAQAQQLLAKADLEDGAGAAMVAAADAADAAAQPQQPLELKQPQLPRASTLEWVKAFIDMTPTDVLVKHPDLAFATIVKQINGRVVVTREPPCPSGVSAREHSCRYDPDGPFAVDLERLRVYELASASIKTPALQAAMKSHMERMAMAGARFCRAELAAGKYNYIGREGSCSRCSEAP